MQHGSVICRVTFSQAQAKSQIFPRRGDVWIRLAGSTRSCCSSTTRRLLTAPKSGHSKKTQTLRCWPEGSNLGWKQCSQILRFWGKNKLGFLDVPSSERGKGPTVGGFTLSSAEGRGAEQGCSGFDIWDYSQTFWTKRARGSVWLLETLDGHTGQQHPTSSQPLSRARCSPRAGQAAHGIVSP